MSRRRAKGKGRTVDKKSKLRCRAGESELLSFWTHCRTRTSTVVARHPAIQGALQGAQVPLPSPRVKPALGPLASGRVQLSVHKSTQLRKTHGRVAPRLVEQSLRGCIKFPLEGALRGRRCHLHDDEMRVLPGAGNLGEQQI